MPLSEAISARNEKSLHNLRFNNMVIDRSLDRQLQMPI